MRWWLKSCPKCRGDIFRDYSMQEWAYKCLQCGHILNRLEEERLGLPQVQVGPLPERAGTFVRRKAA